MTEKLKNAMIELSKKRTSNKHLVKIGEECSELSVEVLKCINKDFKINNDNVLNEIADVLNTIDIYMNSIGKNTSELDEYRLKQVEKHLD